VKLLAVANMTFVLLCVCSFGNIAGDQRVIDVRRGPIRKTAAVKTLPRID